MIARLYFLSPDSLILLLTEFVHYKGMSALFLSLEGRKLKYIVSKIP